MGESVKKSGQRKQRNWQPDPSKGTKEDRALDFFANAMISKIESVQNNWEKPWFRPGANHLPQNLNGRNYNGMNSIILMIQAEREGYELPVWTTYDRIKGMNFEKGLFSDKVEGGGIRLRGEDGQELPEVSVRRGEKSTPVFLTTFSVVNPDTKERIKYDDYKNLSREERDKYKVYPNFQVYNVFNIDQTNLKEARPELYEKLQKRTENNGEYQASTDAIDMIIDKNLWICPIKQRNGDDAYYTMSEDLIVIPERSQFKDGMSFAITSLHEMAHSTGAEHRLNRLEPTQFGSNEYAREELVAELTSAFVASKNGLEKNLKEDSAAYLKSWLSSLQQDPKFIKTVLMDVKRAEDVISKRIDAVTLELKKGERADFSAILDNKDPFRKSQGTDTEQKTKDAVTEKPDEGKGQSEEEDPSKEKSEIQGVDVDGNGDVEADESHEVKNSESEKNRRAGGYHR